MCRTLLFIYGTGSMAGLERRASPADGASCRFAHLVQRVRIWEVQLVADRGHAARIGRVALGSGPDEGVDGASGLRVGRSCGYSGGRAAMLARDQFRGSLLCTPRANPPDPRPGHGDAWSPGPRGGIVGSSLAAEPNARSTASRATPRPRTGDRARRSRGRGWRRERPRQRP